MCVCVIKLNCQNILVRTNTIQYMLARALTHPPKHKSAHRISYIFKFICWHAGTLWKCESKRWACNKSDNPSHKTRLQPRCYCQFSNYNFFRSLLFRHVDVIDIGSCRNLLFCYMLHTHKMHSSLTRQTCQSQFGYGCVCVCYACYFRYTMQSDLLCFYPDFPLFLVIFFVCFVFDTIQSNR